MDSITPELTDHRTAMLTLCNPSTRDDNMRLNLIFWNASWAGNWYTFSAFYCKYLCSCSLPCGRFLSVTCAESACCTAERSWTVSLNGRWINPSIPARVITMIHPPSRANQSITAKSVSRDLLHPFCGAYSRSRSGTLSQAQEYL